MSYMQLTQPRQPRGAPRFPFVFRPRATSRVVHATTVAQEKAIRAPGDEAAADNCKTENAQRLLHTIWPP